MLTQAEFDKFSTVIKNKRNMTPKGFLKILQEQFTAKDPLAGSFTNTNDPTCVGPTRRPELHKPLGNTGSTDHEKKNMVKVMTEALSQKGQRNTPGLK